MKRASDLESCTCCGDERQLLEHTLAPDIVAPDIAQRREEYARPVTSKRPVLA